VLAAGGHAPVVIDAGDLVRRPADTVRAPADGFAEPVGGAEHPAAARYLAYHLPFYQRLHAQRTIAR
jgi:hypothetical protein